MDEAVEQLESALSLARSMAEAARSSQCTAGDSDSQSRLTNALTNLTEPGLLLHAPAGIGLVSPEAICVASGRESIGLMSAHQTDISAGTSITATAEEAISLCAKKADLQLKATQGDVELHAHSGKLHALANTDIKIESVAGRVEISAPNELLLSCGGAYIRIKDGEIELGAPNNLILKVAHVDKFRATTLDTPVTPIPHGYSAGYTIGDAAKGAAPFTRYQITTQWGKVFKGVTDKDGKTMPVHMQLPGEVEIEFPETEGYQAPLLPGELEEEEEEEELTEGITLRLGLFFDGTGNNLSNSSATERCQREDLNLYDASELESLVQTCKLYGYDKFNGELFEQVEDTSYANSASNVAHLYRLYPDHATDGLPPRSGTGYVKVYLEGIGTNSGGKDSLISQGTGKGRTGVVSRVKQAPELLQKQLRDFVSTNPDTFVRRVEIDIFGFSRGAASARHCANEFLKSDRGIFRELLQPSRFGLHEDFDPKVDIRLNLIGLFDTVAAIVNPLVGDFSPGNEHNSGVNLYLPAGCARQVVQLHARDELRENFALNSVLEGHRQIGLPGVHSDVGGGYRPSARERLWVVQPQRIVLAPNQTLENHPRWQTLQKLAQRIQESVRYGKDSSLQALAWATMAAPRGRDESPQRAYWATVVMERMVRGELALIALRVMRELGVRHGVPFDVIDEEDRRFRLPDELKPIATQVLEQIEAGDNIDLNAEQETLLRARYIHCSAHWVPAVGLMINKPARHERRNVYPNLPQKGYPQ
jgi:type VI secretion system secreted protein VgrG